MANWDLDDTGGQCYVKRQTELWEQWGKVGELMIQRDPDKVKANNNGFKRFGKECREFCCRFQTMYHLSRAALPILLSAHAAAPHGRLHARVSQAWHVPWHDGQLRG